MLGKAKPHTGSSRSGIAPAGSGKTVHRAGAFPMAFCRVVAPSSERSPANGHHLVRSGPLPSLSSLPLACRAFQAFFFLPAALNRFVVRFSLDCDTLIFKRTLGFGIPWLSASLSIT